MRFFNFLTYTSLAAAVPLASPNAEPIDQGLSSHDFNKRALISGSITNTVIGLNTSTAGYLATINQAITFIKSSKNATAIKGAQDTLKAGLQNITAAIGQAGTAIQSGTNGATSGFLGTIQGLTQPDVTQLTGAIDQLNTIIAKLKVLSTVTTANLPSDVASAISKDVLDLKNAIPKLNNPILNLASALFRSALTGRLTLADFNTAVQSVIAAALSLV